MFKCTGYFRKKALLNFLLTYLVVLTKVHRESYVKEVKIVIGTLSRVTGLKFAGSGALHLL